jgi:hypothetical protein
MDLNYERLDSSATGQNATPVTKDQFAEDYMRKTYELQKEMDNKLGAIKGWLTFIGIVILIGIVFELFNSCGVLFR